MTAAASTQDSKGTTTAGPAGPPSSASASKTPPVKGAAPTAAGGRWAAVRARLGRMAQGLGLVWRCSPSATLGLLGLTLLGVVLPLGIAYVGKSLVDAVVAHDQKRALLLVGVELALVVLQTSMQRVSGLVRGLLGARLSVDINVQILSKALTLDLRHFEDPQFYDQLTRARREASSRPLAMVTDVLQLGQSVLMLLGYIGLLWSFSPLAVLVLVLAALPAAAGEMRFSKVAFRLRNWRAPETRRLNYLEYVLASDEHAKEVKVLGLGPVLLDRYRTLGESFYREDRSLAVRRAGWGALLSLLGTLAFYGCYLFIVGLAAAGRITLGEMTLYVVAFQRGQQAFQSSLSGVGGLYEHDLYMSNLFEYLAIPTAAQAALASMGTTAAATDAGAAVVQAERGIRFDGVGFAYPGQDKFALRGINLFIPAGQSLALVGHNGAGKTTFIKLLSGLYQPTEGRILLDGQDLRTLPEEVLQRRIGVVFQDFNQYQFSVRENIAFGSVEHLADEPRIERAVQRGGAEEIVRGLPSGLETMLGRWFQKGVELSGGQWQRVALARAFMREQADILILDEPTAALDAEAEHQVFQRFAELSAGRTALLISHRFPTVRMADRIVVLEGGGIVEQGSHDELLAAGGRYASLFALQAKGYL
jgi:ATP-binding cassette subfamily B protein